jgi:hypothetical protein
MGNDFRLLMLGAMYENGGNTTHRFLDGHPQLFVYPYEAQVGTRHVQDALAATFPLKYRWPAFALDATPADDYRAIIDEECKVRVRTPHVSKFRYMPFDFSDDERGRLYAGHIGRSGRSRANNMAAFFRATFDAWKDYRRTGREQVYVGYSPIIADSLRTPTWNGTVLPEVYPWGTIRTPTPEANRATALELSEVERAKVRSLAWQYLEIFDYKSFV